MNVQIFGTKKSADTRKAERFFKERRIKYQFIDLIEKEMSRGEFQSVCQAVGGIEALIDPNCRDEDLKALLPYLGAESKQRTVFENQEAVLLLPIVRNGKQATCGYQPEIWKKWS